MPSSSFNGSLESSEASLYWTEVAMQVSIPVAGTIYGVFCFTAGFVSGAIREFILIPAIGTTTGHLIEFPLILVAIGVIARLLVRRSFAGSAMSHWLALGVIGVTVLVVIESTFALAIMGVPLATYLAGYDVTEGALFPLGLLWMAVAPMVMGRRGDWPEHIVTHLTHRSQTSCLSFLNDGMEVGASVDCDHFGHRRARVDNGRCRGERSSAQFREPRDTETSERAATDRYPKYASSGTAQLFTREASEGALEDCEGDYKGTVEAHEPGSGAHLAPANPSR